MCARMWQVRVEEPGGETAADLSDLTGARLGLIWNKKELYVL